MAISDDFTIDYTNKRIAHTANNNVYTVNELYSWLQDTFDELAQMDDPVPMSAQTPNAYTMINGWWLDIGDGSEAHKYLKEGAIQTDGYGSYAIHRLEVDGQTTQAQASDIGEVVSDDATAVGPLLGFKTTSGTTQIWWIRDTRGTPIQIGDGSVMTIANSSADGSADGSSASGEELFANIYTLGTLASNPSPQIYIFQAGEAIDEWSDKANWDRGHIDVLIQVKEAGTEIDNAVVTVFARQQGDLFDHFEIDLSAGGRNAVPLSTSSDLNNTTPDYYIFYDSEASGPFAEGDVIYHPASGDVQWSAEVVSVDDWGTEGVLGIRGYKDDGSNPIADNDAFTNGTATANVNGSASGCLGTGYIHYDAESGAFATGLVLTGGTSGAKRRIIGIQDDGTVGKILFDLNTGITGNSRDPYYIDYQDDEGITDTGTGSASADVATGYENAVAGFDDVTVVFVNGTVTHGGTTGTFIEGERVTWNDGSEQEGILLKDTGSVVTLGNCTSTSLNTNMITGDISGATCTPSQDLQSAHTINKAFEQQSAYPYDVVVECGSIYNAGRPVLDVYEYLKFLTEEDADYQMYTVDTGVITPLDGEEYIQAYSGYSPKKQAPFGTFAGGVFFGAQSVWIEGMDSVDIENFQLIDANGDTRTPPTSATMKVTSLVNGDRVLVCLTSGGVINKAQYNSHDTNNSAGDGTFEVEEDIAQDTPSEGILRVVDDNGSDTFPEQRYRYSSWSGKIFTLSGGASGSCTTGGSGYTTQLIDSAADFGGTDDLEVGDVIRNITDGSSAIVTEIVNSTTINHTPLEGGTNNYWTSGDTYDNNQLDRTYDDGDTAYVPLIDEQASTDFVGETVLYLSDRAVMVRVRKKGIIPFETSGTFTSAGLTVAAIRTSDGIVT